VIYSTGQVCGGCTWQLREDGSSSCRWGAKWPCFKDYSVITAQLRSLSRTSNRLNLQYILSSFTSFYLVQMFSTLTPQHLYSTPKHRMACHCRLFAPNCQVVRANPKKSMFLFVDRLCSQNCSLANKKKLLPCLYRRQWGKKNWYCLLLLIEPFCHLRGI